MRKLHSIRAVSSELSSDVAAAILTRQSQLNRDPVELMNIVLAVHNTLQELSDHYSPCRSVVRSSSPANTSGRP